MPIAQSSYFLTRGNYTASQKHTITPPTAVFRNTRWGGGRGRPAKKCPAVIVVVVIFGVTVQWGRGAKNVVPWNTADNTAILS